MSTKEIIIKESNGKRFEQDMSDKELIQELLYYSECRYNLRALEITIDFANKIGIYDFDDMREQCQKSVRYYGSNKRRIRKEITARHLKYDYIKPDVISCAIEMIKERKRPVNVEITIIEDRGKGREEMSSEEMIFYYVDMIAELLYHIQETGGVDIMGEMKIILQAIFYLDRKIRERGVAYRLEFPKRGKQV